MQTCHHCQKNRPQFGSRFCADCLPDTTAVIMGPYYRRQSINWLTIVLLIISAFVAVYFIAWATEGVLP